MVGDHNPIGVGFRPASPTHRGQVADVSPIQAPSRPLWGNSLSKGAPPERDGVEICDVSNIHSDQSVIPWPLEEKSNQYDVVNLPRPKMVIPSVSGHCS